MENRPRAREKNVTSGGSGVHRRGSGLGTGPVGMGGGNRRSGGGSGGKRAAGGGGILVVIAAVLLYFMKGGGGGGNTEIPSGSDLPFQSSYSSSDTFTADNAQSADTSVASGSREKRTKILGGGKDTMTLMVYVCGTDLESKSGMASSDIQEMAGAKFGDNVNLILYTGGCKSWKLNGISESSNQIYWIKDGKMQRLESNMGNKAMTDPATLTEFIRYCTKNFPANRNELILWDHGGGSVSGFGYDEKNAGKGSMDLAGISRALKDSGTTFDFIGFDACLMATAENALMLNNYADYLIASEETEPGIGWYYTNWLTKVGSNTSMPTVEIGKNIVDDFVTECGKKCAGQKTTLSVIDLAEFSNTVPAKLSAFADSLSKKMTDQAYKEVSDARYRTREFATSSKIDQIDLVDFTKKVGTSEGKALASAIQGAVKYNRTSANMTNAHGVSIYFPYKRSSYVDSASKTYEKIDMDASYTKCIRQFASLQTSGQIASGGSSGGSPITSIFGNLGSGGSGGSSSVIGSLLNGFLSGSSDRVIDGLDSTNTGYMKDNPLSEQQTADYIAANYFDTSKLVWEKSGSSYKMSLPESQWSLVHRLDKSIFYDDGSGYVDMGLDNLYSFDNDGSLIADTDRDWLAVNGQPVAYYHTDTIENGDKWTISGYIPAMLNGTRVKLIVVFDNDHKDGYIAGAATDYRSGETDTIAKSMVELQVGDKLDFVCDYYDYNKNYKDSYYLGEQMTVDEKMTLSNVSVGSGKVKIMYCFTDIYDQMHWTEAIDK